MIWARPHKPLEAPPIDRPVNAVKIFMVEVLSTNHTRKQLLIKYFPAAAMGHPANYMSVPRVRDYPVQLHWKRYPSFFIVCILYFLRREQLRKMSRREIVVCVIYTAALDGTLFSFPMMIITASIHYIDNMAADTTIKT